MEAGGWVEEEKPGASTQPESVDPDYSFILISIASEIKVVQRRRHPRNGRQLVLRRTAEANTTDQYAYSYRIRSSVSKQTAGRRRGLFTSGRNRYCRTDFVLWELGSVAELLFRVRRAVTAAMESSTSQCLLCCRNAPPQLRVSASQICPRTLWEYKGWDACGPTVGKR